MKNDSDLFFTCSLIEFIGRKQKLKRADVVLTLGEQKLQHIYHYADVLHCEPIERIADEFITSCNIPTGNFDNEKSCQYAVPDYWTIGEVYARLIEDISENNIIKTLMEIYASWISDSLSNYNSDFYYQPRDYIRECYRQNDILA